MPTIKKMIFYGIEKLFYVTKTELRSMSYELILIIGAEISREDLIANVSTAMINEEENSMDLMLALIEKEKEDEDSV